MAKENTQSNKVMKRGSHSFVLSRPRITEKATALSNEHTYVFEVRRDATKNEIKKAVQTFFKVHPVWVNVVAGRTKKVRSPKTGKIGTTSSSKKAYVRLKKGETISLT